MNLEDLFPSRRHHSSLPDRLTAQVNQLRREIGDISSVLSREAQNTASEWGHEAAKQGAWLAGIAGRKAVKGADAVRRDPLPALAIVGTAILLTALFTRR
ncbi:MAG: hypothetical protein IR164_04370 [Devosia sp.]|jgi:hypothetical protein|uniref:hypothetical protein n=1 Tax=unclassified Devosia TaxID=196773 RepID=UPI001A0AC390|nr:MULTISPECIES: hypothetical protein [unclassified Devosia]MBF0678158.1 hypothetical protein [Devosia sp.]WEJ31416.1 hypothetical protein NYQ88_10855 [Devosia sp. SD17-2]